MKSFDMWRREVNIILNDTLGFSLGSMEEYIEQNIRLLYSEGEDPMDGAQYAAREIDNSLDLEQIIADRLSPKYGQ